MKREKFGLAGSVTVIGSIYLLALALAPSSGLSNPSYEAASGNAAADKLLTCPYAAHARLATDRLLELHRGMLGEQTQHPGRPAWGNGKLTVF